LDYFNEIIDEFFEIVDAVVHIRRFVDFCEGLVEDCNHVAEETCCYAFKDEGHDLLFIALTSIQLEELSEPSV
jgi:hypothetical protein